MEASTSGDRSRSASLRLACGSRGRSMTSLVERLADEFCACERQPRIALVSRNRNTVGVTPSSPHRVKPAVEDVAPILDLAAGEGTEFHRTTPSSSAALAPQSQNLPPLCSLQQRSCSSGGQNGQRSGGTGRNSVTPSESRSVSRGPVHLHVLDLGLIPIAHLAARSMESHRGTSTSRRRLHQCHAAVADRWQCHRADSHIASSIRQLACGILTRRGASTTALSLLRWRDSSALPEHEEQEDDLHPADDDAAEE